MKKRVLLSFALSFIGIISAIATPKNNVLIVPQPSSIEYSSGAAWTINGTLSVIMVDGAQDSELYKTAVMFAEDVAKILTFTPRVFTLEQSIYISSITNMGNIVLSIDSTLDKEEYKVDVSSKQIAISGGSEAGVFYGLQTLKQLLASNAEWKSTDKVSAAFSIPAMVIEDKPSFGYRGAMLDVCRHFADKEDVKKFIDMLAMHKMNIFHWHLTDDQGWRIQIKSHPALTDVGSVRRHTLIGHGGIPPFKYDGKPYAGCYTQDEIREVVQYAAERYITIIPEIEMPGHATAALAAYPEIGCTGGPYEVWARWGVNNEVFCAGNERTFEILQDVVGEGIELFPAKIIHIGGDECPKERWHECPKCQERMRENNIPDEHHLQSYFIQRIEKWLNERGRTIIGWDEILEGGLSQNAIVMSWRGQSGGIAAAKAGNYVVMSPTDHSYLDYYQSKDYDNEPFAIGGFVPLEKAYLLDPYAGLEPQYHKYILGVQGNLWREYIETMPHTYYMLLPRLAAIAETGWAYERKDFEGFVNRLPALCRLYEIYGYDYARHIWQGGGRIN